ncbi:hypothetical protein Nit79A3_0284 [Nitrosomonas sp. Is79A3]
MEQGCLTYLNELAIPRGLATGCLFSIEREIIA